MQITERIVPIKPLAKNLTTSRGEIWLDSKLLARTT
jgi:hypothetical protein